MRNIASSVLRLTCNGTSRAPHAPHLSWVAAHIPSPLRLMHRSFSVAWRQPWTPDDVTIVGGAVSHGSSDASASSVGATRARAARLEARAAALRPDGQVSEEIIEAALRAIVANRPQFAVHDTNLHLLCEPPVSQPAPTTAHTTFLPIGMNRHFGLLVLTSQSTQLVDPLNGFALLRPQAQRILQVLGRTSASCVNSRTASSFA